MSIFIFLLLSASFDKMPKFNYAQAANEAKTQDVSDPELGVYSVSVLKSGIEVEPVKPKGDKKPYLRMQVFRSNDRPYELRLTAIDSTPPRYTGEINPWNGSYTGLQLEFSFDKKTWKRLGHLIRGVMP